MYFAERRDISELVTINAVSHINILERTDFERKPDGNDMLDKGGWRAMSANVIDLNTFYIDVLFRQLQLMTASNIYGVYLG